jgi:hypothetical protein
MFPSEVNIGITTSPGRVSASSTAGVRGRNRLASRTIPSTVELSTVNRTNGTVTRKTVSSRSLVSVPHCSQYSAATETHAPQ